MQNYFKTIALVISLIVTVENINAQAALGLSFDGVDDRATIPYSANYNLGTGAFIVEAWIKANSTQPFTEPTIFSNREAANGNTGIQLFLSNGKLRARLGGTLTAEFGNDLRDGNCHHVAIRRQSTQLYFYVDGVYINSVSSMNQSINTTHPVWIGHDENTPATTRFKGVIHELRFWNTSTIVFTTLTKTYLNGNESSLRGYWRMNDGSGQIINDLTSYNNDGYPGTTTSAESSDPTYVTGCMCTTTAAITSGGGTVICGYQGITLTATAGAGLTYQWKKNGSNITGATNQTYAATTAGDYTCAILNGNCGNTSNIITLTSNNPNVSIAFGGSQYICNGGSSLLNSSVSNGGTPAYQWKLNGSNIAGATATTYSATQSGTYTLLVTNTTNGCSALSSSSLVLTVFNSSPTSAISFSSISSACNVVPMQITGGSTNGFTYQWQYNSTNMSGQTSVYAYAGGTGSYRCAVTNACGTSFTNTLNATVLGTGYITYAGSTSFCTGSLSLNAPYIAGAAYQWYHGNNAIAGATSWTYIATGAGVYSCYIYTDDCGAQQSNNSITIDGPPVISAQGPLAFCTGSVTLEANGGTTATSYQWKNNGSNIAGATTSTYAATTSGSYTCEVTSTLCGTKLSNALNVTPGVATPITVLYGTSGVNQSIDICIGNAMATAQPCCAGTYSLKDLFTTQTIFSQTNNDFGYLSTGYYYIELDNGCGVTQSSSFGVRDINSIHAVTSDGLTSFCSSAIPPNLYIAHTSIPWGGSPPYSPAWDTYVWKLNGVPISGANMPSYSPTQSGWYSATITNSCGAAQYVDSLQITVSQAPSTNVTANGPLTFCQGQSVAFNVTPTTGATYQWVRNGFNIAGATSTSYTATTAGTYKVGVSNSGCATVYSADQVVTITIPFTPTATCNNPTVLCSGQTATLQSITGAGYTYQWNLSGTPISGATSSSYTTGAIGSYTVKVTDAQNCYNVSSAIVLTSGLHSANITSTNGNPVCASTGTYSMNSNATGSDITSYQWKFNGAVISGATTSVYSQQVALLSSGSYTVEVTNGCGTFISAPYVLTVNPLPNTPVISASTNNFCGTGSVTLNSTTQTGVTYQWYNPSPISGATNSSYAATSAGNYSVRTTNANGCIAYSTTFSVYNSGFSPTITPNNVTGVCSTQVYTVTPATGVTYQWYKNGSTLTGATSASYAATSSGTYSCAITKAGCGTTTIAAPGMVVVAQVYSVTANTTNPNLCTGQTSYVSVPSSSYYQYQWKLNGTNIAGATQYSYFVTATGSYTCLVTQPCGTTTSNAVSVTVNTPPTASITASGSTNLCNGASVTLNANTGAGLTYQWTTNNQTITGATSSSYITNVGGTYRCIVTGSGCSATSNFINVFTGAGASAVITGNNSFCAGFTTTLSANTGAGITYQWYKNGVAQSGATSSTYLIGNAGTYYVVENSTCGTATSNSIVVTQINNPTPTITYTTPLTFCSPGTILLTSSTFSGVTYQWEKNSVVIAGATSQTYTATSNGKYKVKQSANGCYKYAPEVTVALATSVTAAITANGPTSFCTGGSVVLSVNSAVPGYSYQWKNNNVNISGATTSSYTATAAGSYTCTVSATCGNATSSAIVVSTGGIVALVNPSGTVNICTGAAAALSANTGTGFTFQWKKNGTNIAGATSASYNATTSGAYTVAITSPCGNATSAATTVNIAALAANITPTGTTTICNGQAATFTANTGYNFTYQWYRNGGAITGATSSTHANSAAGNYTVVISQGGVCSATSNITVLAVTNNPNPSVTAGGPTTFCVGQSVTLTANAFAGVTYQWTKNGINIAGATNQTYTATTSGQYSVKETANGCTKQLGVPIVVTVNCKLGNEVIEVNGDLGIKAIPNPFTNEINVTLNNSIANNSITEIKLINVLGETVMNETVRNTTSNLQLQTSNLPAGVYFLQVTTSSEKKTVKVVKQ